jgi:hypothetical protein
MAMAYYFHFDNHFASSNFRNHLSWLHYEDLALILLAFLIYCFQMSFQLCLIERTCPIKISSMSCLPYLYFPLTLWKLDFGIYFLLGILRWFHSIHSFLFYFLIAKISNSFVRVASLCLVKYYYYQYWILFC